MLYYVKVKNYETKKTTFHGPYETYMEAYEAMDGPEFDWVPLYSSLEVVEKNPR